MIGLAGALRRYHSNVDELVVPLDPEQADIAGVRERAQGYDLVVVGTINAADHSGQGALVNALLEAGTKVLAVALRLPYDIEAYLGAPPTCAPTVCSPRPLTPWPMPCGDAFRSPGSCLSPCPTSDAMTDALYIKPAAILTDGRKLEHMAVLVQDGRIAALAHENELSRPARAREIVAEGLLLAPGLVDLQINGAFGSDFTAEPDFDLEGRGTAAAVRRNRFPAHDHYLAT